jgi:small subunit ribosomal protein S16
MLNIRLTRVGKKNKPMYRLTIAEKTKDPYGKALEILGSYNPHSKELQVKGDRIQYWISQGAQMTPTVNNLLVEQKIIEGKKVVASKKGKKAEEAKIEEAKKVKTEKSAPTETPKADAPAPTEALAEMPKEEVKTEIKEETPAEPAA